MQDLATAHPSLRKPSNGNGNGRIHGIASVVKRNSETVDYSKLKIIVAVRNCFINSLEWPADQAQDAADKVATQVDHLLPFEEAPVSVERIQDMVEQQLMALGYHDAAKAYILYREEHRRAREEQQVDPAIVEAFGRGKEYFTGPNHAIQLFQAMNKFARFDWDKGRREIWPETVDRVVGYTKQHLDADFAGKVDPKALERLRDGLVNLRAAPAMRLVQMAGPALERCQTGVFNCSFQFLKEPRDMAEELYLLMQGCGVGFSVEAAHATDKWSRIKKQRKRANKDTFVVEDTTEGWCDSYLAGIERWMDGYDIEYDYSKIRPEGAILKTKGGRASGPQPLMDLHTFARNQFLSRQGQRLHSIHLHDVNCFAHRIVQMGGVRRASGISLSDLEDDEMRRCKDGEFWNNNPQRNQANNSAVYDEQPDALTFMEEWMSLAKSGSGERGIFNRGSLRRHFPERRKVGRWVFGTNPCGEIILRHKQFCNLSIAVIRPTDTWDEILEKVVLATIWGTIQSTMTHFSYVCDDWKKNCEDERLLGVDLLGHLDHPLLKPGSEGLAARLDSLLRLVRQTNEEWSQQLGINPSVAVTCGKPSGDSSQFFDCAAGFKPHHGEYYIRRCRVNASDPVGRMLRDQGVPCHMDYDNSGLLVLEFPVKAPEGALILGDMTALEQLEHWKVYKQHYTEHNPSVSIYVKDDEWFRVGNWVYENWEIVSGLAFMPHFGGVYPLAPYEAIDEARYEKRAAAFPDIDWSQIVRYEDEDMTVSAQTYACTGDQCSLV